MKTARSAHSCTTHDEHILVIGGRGAALRSVDMFNTILNTWTVLTSLPVDMYFGHDFGHDMLLGQAGTLSNNIVFAMTYDSDTVYTTNDLKTWTKTVISNFDSGTREVFPAPLVPSTMINC